jgi:UDP-glucose 6-dehydrogenase
VKDLEAPDRVLVGSHEAEAGRAARDVLVEIYANWVPRDRIVTSNVWSAELSKLAANAFLAQRVSSINSISALCEKTSADICEVAAAVGMDRRIGNRFLEASVGFGGSCFKKDTGDTRESPAIAVARKLIEERAIVVISDPKALPNARKELADAPAGSVEFEANPCVAARGSHAVAVLTEWDCYRTLDYRAI